MNKNKGIISGVLAWIWLIIVLIPIYYVVVTSLKPLSEFYSNNPLLPSGKSTIEAYMTVLENNFHIYFFNTVFITLLSLLVIVLVCVSLSFYIVRKKSWLSRQVHKTVLMGLGIPLQAVIVPVYYLVIQLGLYDTLSGIILPSIAFAIPLSVIILVNFMRDIPEELFDSMNVDGASQIGILCRLVIPMSRPAITTVAIYQALQIWNGFLFPLILTQSAEKRVLTLSLWSYQGEFSSNIPAILAAVTLSAIPVAVAYIFGRKQLVAGMTAGIGK